jgi:hypothetical protein
MDIIGTSTITAIVGTMTTTITTVATAGSLSQFLVTTTQTIPSSSTSASPIPGSSTRSAALSPGATAGLGTGIALVILLLAGLFGLYVRERNRRQATEASAGQTQLSGGITTIDYSGTASSSKTPGRVELDSLQI